MYAIDVQYFAFETALTQERQQLGFLSTVTNIGLTGTASLITPVVTKNILTAIAAGLTGTKAAFNDEILLNRTIQVLQSQMRGNRSRKASLILSRLGSPSSVYPLGLALSDLEEYYQAGTITSALLDVTGAVAQETINAKYEKEGAVVIARPASDETRRVLVGLLYPKGRPAGMDPNLRAYLRELLGPDAVFLPQFIVDPQYAMVRLNMINCIKKLQANNRCAANSLKVF